jgi:hypothetical protein
MESLNAMLKETGTTLVEKRYAPYEFGDPNGIRTRFGFHG